MRTLLTILLVLGVLLVARLSLFTVDASEYAYVTVLGRHVATHDGASAEGPGLHVGWPWPLRSVQRLDRRLQFFDLPAREILTYDPKGKTIDKTLTVEAFVLWRIQDGDAVDLFIRRLGTAEQARNILGQRISSQLVAAISQLSLDDLVNLDPDPENRPGLTRVDYRVGKLQEKLLRELHEPILQEYGIDLIEVRLRRFNHPERVRDSIFRRIKSEREKIVAQIQSEGKLEAEKIEIAADEKSRKLLAKARYDEEKLKGQADTEAMLIRNQAHSQDPEFYGFLKKMEKLQSILGDNRTVLLLSTHRPLFDLLFQAPKPGEPLPDKKKP